MLKEHIDKLRILLDDSETINEEELNRQHRDQTANMIADYKKLNGGARTKRIIISRSLPEALRPKSPRSTSSSASSLRCSRESEQSDNSYLPYSREQLCSKRVSFHDSASQKSRNSDVSVSQVSKLPSSNKTTSRTNSHRCTKESSNTRASSSSGSSYASDDSEADDIVEVPSARHITTNESNYERNSHIKNKLDSHKQSSSKPGSSAKRRESMEFLDLRASRENVKYGTYEDLNGRKHSDNNLKRTANIDIKRWLKAKEREVREMKREQKLKEKERQLREEQEKQQREERKVESSKKLREWQAAKRKQARLLRRQNIAKLKLESQKLSNSTSDLKTSKRPNLENQDQKQSTSMKPTAPTKQRPMSAPPTRRRVVKPKVALDEVIKNSPDLQERLKTLEKEKKLKHRQSYDEWLRAKEKEKKDVMKTVREQRAKLEKDLSQETAKIISEAAKRRSENIRYKGSEATQAEKAHKETEKPPKTKTANNASAQRKTDATEEEKVSHSPTRPDSAPRSTPVFPRANRESTGPKSRKPKVEETIPETKTNPYSDPFKPPKLRRPKSKLEQGGVNGPDFSRFIWNLVNEQGNDTSRPEPQGADSPERSPEANKSKSDDGLKVPPPKKSASPKPPEKTDDFKPKSSRDLEEGVPIIENGRTIFSMTSIE
ncbi:axoneme-associated protein mst101(2)-like [Watersipora subatra]|uniref:axoneme-associated protein mst101(2)-like n=1 Tax=Watersipora subatra TaxID=2589382 RepID=UPI00355BAF59